jgi:hypothetical protein
MRCERMSLEKFETWIPAKTRVADQNLLACSAFLSSRGGCVGALWTMFVDQRKAHRRWLALLAAKPPSAGWHADLRRGSGVEQ